MEINTKIALFKEYVSQMENVFIKKSEDYANEDVLSNFKLSGKVIGLPPEMVCLTLISIKVARLGNLLSSGKKPNNESIQDNLLDLANYSLLLRMILEETSNTIIKTNT